MGPKGLVTAPQLPPNALQANVMGLPKFAVSGTLSSRTGEFVWRLWFHDAAACSVSPVMTRATSDDSIPLMRKSWPLVLKKMLPTTPGSKKATCTSSQSSRYTAPFHCRRWSKNSVFQPLSLFVRRSDEYDVGIMYCGTSPGVKACFESPFWLNPPGRNPCENV